MITELIRPSAAGIPHELRVRLDEKVGHNTQGFLPIIQPHFGGLWQDVGLLIVPSASMDDLELLAYGDPETGCLRLEFPLRGQGPPESPELTVRYRLAAGGQSSN